MTTRAQDTWDALRAAYEIGKSETTPRVVLFDYAEAVDCWKSNDEWRFADKEAAWRFFFAAGRSAADEMRAKDADAYWKAREHLINRIEVLAARNTELTDELDPHIDGVVPVQMTDAERGFLNGMLIGNLRRIYAAHDDEGNDLSALPSRAADEIERLQGHISDEYEEAMQELDRHGIPRADGDGPTFTLRGRMLRFLIRMTSNAK